MQLLLGSQTHICYHFVVRVDTSPEIYCRSPKRSPFTGEIHPCTYPASGPVGGDLRGGLKLACTILSRVSADRQLGLQCPHRDSNCMGACMTLASKVFLRRVVEALMCSSIWLTDSSSSAEMGRGGCQDPSGNPAIAGAAQNGLRTRSPGITSRTNRCSFTATRNTTLWAQHSLYSLSNDLRLEMPWLAASVIRWITPAPHLVVCRPSR
jgi:hypothetical protein